jgi:hypothetical protein
MAKINERVMEFVRREIAKDPDVRSTSLYEQAKKVDRSISRLSLRQFHARYPLQVKRTMKSAARRGPGRPPGVAKRGRRGRPPGPTATGRRPGRPRKTAAPAAPAAAASRAATTDSREAVRAVLLEFAGSVARVENKADMISLVGGVDGWVDRVLSATR